MSVETQRKNIVHRILDIDNSQLLSKIEELLNNEVYRKFIMVVTAMGALLILFR